MRHHGSGGGSGGNGGGMFRPDFDQAPFLVIWETTQACDLACKHCRAEARPWRDPNELSTYEAKRPSFLPTMVLVALCLERRGP